MIEDVVLQKFRGLPRKKQREVLSFLEFLEFQQYEQRPLSADEQLEAAAKALLSDYASDPELVAFTALDGEEFHA